MIREALLADCEEIAKVHVQSWKEAYEGLFPDAYLSSLSVEDRAERWRQIVKADSDIILLNIIDDQIVGFADVCRCRDSDASKEWAELAAIYYLKEQWGKGLATVLLEKALTKYAEEGFSICTLWVLDQNERAVSFYRKHGFEFDGAEKTGKRGEYTTHELRMRRA